MPTAQPKTRLGPIALVALLLLSLLSPQALGQDEKHVEIVETAVSSTGLKPGTSAMAAVVLDIKPGFHAQSNTPGENLIPFTAEAAPPEGIKAGDPILPRGELKEYPQLGKLSVYDGRVVVRIPLQIAADAKPGEVAIKGKLGYQICNDTICFAPDSTPFEIKTRIVAADAEVRPANPELFKGYVADASTRPAGKPRDPDARAWVDAVLSTSALQPGKTGTLAVVLDVKPTFHAQSHKPFSTDYIPTVVEPKPVPGVTFGPVQYPPGQTETYPGLGELSVYSGRAIMLVPVQVSADAQPGTELTIAGGVQVQICDDQGICFPPQTLPFEVRTQVVAADQAVTANEPELFAAAAAMMSAPPPPAPGRVAPAAPAGGDNLLEGRSVPALFGIAFLVGIIFNIVPCVLPVLPLKAIGFYETAQHNRGKSVSFGLVFSLGVIASFAVLGLFVVVLRTFAWGEIFSNPWFSLTLVVILVVMALNMFGLFTVNLPAGAYAFTPRHDTYVGNFLFGILTAALSTPCTFGLFVSLLAVALTLPPAVGLLLVTTVGAGMASPYLALSAMPEVARRFPRTGPWAELVKQFMGFLLLGVAIFFATPWIAPLIEQHNVWWVIFAVLVAGGVFLVAKSAKHGKTAVAPTVAVVLALLLIVPGFFAAQRLAIRPYQWQPYTAELLARKQAANEVVLVEFTASWCSNCHALEAVVLNSEQIQQAVREHDVEMVKVDLSDDDAPGWDLLRNQLKAEGVPLTVIYSPHLAEPIRLAGFYSKDDLTAALARASQPQTAMK